MTLKVCFKVPSILLALICIALPFQAEAKVRTATSRQQSRYQRDLQQNSNKNNNRNQNRNNRTSWTYNYRDNITYPDPFNVTAHRVNDSNASYWMTPPYYYNGTHYMDGNQTFPCVRFTNGSNGTNCSRIYGDLYLRGYYDVNTTRCQSVLMQSYGFSGIPIASTKDTNALCPLVKSSCCTTNDFFAAYRTWQNDGSRGALIEKVNFLNNTYSEFLGALINAQALITNIAAKIPITNNCKVLANTISQFQINDVASYLNSIVRGFFGYLSKNFESFTCAMCDSNNHQFFDLTRQRIVVSHQQCRNFAAQALPFLLYFHVHVVKVTNLVVDFVGSCDAHGSYTKMHIDESLFKLQVSRKVQRRLYNCRRDKDSANWFKSCLPVCREFSLTKISDFLIPNLRKMAPIASFIKGNLQVIQNQIFNNLAADAVGMQRTNIARVLSVKKLRKPKAKDLKKPALRRRLQQSRPPKPYNYQTIRTLNLERLEKTVVPTALNARVDLDQLETVFAANGIDLSPITDSFAFTEGSYQTAFSKWAASQVFGAGDANVNLTIQFATTKAIKANAKKNRNSVAVLAALVTAFLGITLL